MIDCKAALAQVVWHVPSLNEVTDTVINTAMST